MTCTTADWAGNHVSLQGIEGTDLTLVEWHRPRHGAWRGARVLDPGELQHVRAVLHELDRVRLDPARHDDHAGRSYVRHDLAGSPLHLESLLADLLER